jgi:hypothetical protein
MFFSAFLKLKLKNNIFKTQNHMFKGFKLEPIRFISDDHYTFCHAKGEEFYESYKYQVKQILDAFFFEDKSLDGSAIINHWFPQINADIFISHSHDDRDLAVALSGWFHDNFGITTFIDSCIWGHSRDLNKLLDENWIDIKNGTCDYDKVLQSTSHVHMMLSTALNMMIDKTECLLFLDTKNSIKPYNEIEKTESPWIYSEIAFSQIAKRNIPSRLKKNVIENRYFSLNENFEKGGLTIKYDLHSNHLTSINAETFNSLLNYTYIKDSGKVLNQFYEIALPKISDTLH